MPKQLPRLPEIRDREDKQRRCQSLIARAVKIGKLIRPDTCELCGDKPKSDKRTLIYAHHHAGYDQPHNVWWVCHTCNLYLSGVEFHNGTVSKEEAMEFVFATRKYLHS